MKLLENAEYSTDAQIKILKEIGFISKNQEIVQLSQKLIEPIVGIVTPINGFIAVIALYILAAYSKDWSIGLGFAQILLLCISFLIGYQQWIRAECNRNVEDATSKKTALNEMIRNNIQLLYPYVGSVFGFDMEYCSEPIEPSSRIIIDMYIFSELDNLEFTFQKAKFGLVYPEFSFRAIKIFISRAENSKFALRSSQLLINGRYNEDFQKVANKLIHIGLYTKEAKF